MRAIEMTGTVDEGRNLRVEGSLPVSGPMRVRVIVLYPEEDVEEGEWLRTAARKPAFDFLKDPEEVIYTLADGKPFHDQRFGLVSPEIRA